jgi:hypothetical protein
MKIREKKMTKVTLEGNGVLWVSVDGKVTSGLREVDVTSKTDHVVLEGDGVLVIDGVRYGAVPEDWTEHLQEHCIFSAAVPKYGTPDGHVLHCLEPVVGHTLYMGRGICAHHLRYMREECPEIALEIVQQ